MEQEDFESIGFVKTSGDNTLITGLENDDGVIVYRFFGNEFWTLRKDDINVPEVKTETIEEFNDLCRYVGIC